MYMNMMKEEVFSPLPMTFSIINIVPVSIEPQRRNNLLMSYPLGKLICDFLVHMSATFNPFNPLIRVATLTQKGRQVTTFLEVVSGYYGDTWDSPDGAVVWWERRVRRSPRAKTSSGASRLPRYPIQGGV